MIDAGTRAVRALRPPAGLADDRSRWRPGLACQRLERRIALIEASEGAYLEAVVA